MFKNIAFNFISRIISAFSTFLFVPFYVSLLGGEGYSIIALSIVVVSMVMLLDFGLSSAIGREMARSDISSLERKKAFLTLERFFLIIFALSVVIGLSVSGFAAERISSGIKVEKFVILLCVIFIAIEAGLQLLVRYYLAVMTGLERQVKVGIFNICWVLLRNGVVIFIIQWKNNLLFFFIWQALVTFAAIFILRSQSRASLFIADNQGVVEADLATLKRLSGFARGMFLISLVTVLNTQADRVVIGAIGGVTDLGVYTLSATMGTAVLMAVTPIMLALQPRLTGYFTSNNSAAANRLYSLSARGVALLLLPGVSVIICNPNVVMTAWLGNVDMAASASQIVQKHVLANAFVALASVGYAVAIANGYTRLSNQIGLTSLALSIPGYLISFRYYGIEGVAYVYLCVQVFSTVSFSFLIMRKFLGGRALRRHAIEFGLPCVVAAASAYLLSVSGFFSMDTQFHKMLILSLSVLLVLVITAFLTLVLWRVIERHWVWQIWRGEG